MFRKTSLIVAASLLTLSATAMADRSVDPKAAARPLGHGNGYTGISPTETNFTLDINLAGYSSYAGYTSTLNTRSTHTLAPNAFITGVEWLNLDFSTQNGSWLSEFVLSTNTSTESAFFDHAPSSTDGSGNYTGSGTFGTPASNSAGGPFQLLADGKLLVYVYETFNDAGNAVDAIVNSGTLRVHWSDNAPPPPTPPVSIAASLGGSTSAPIAASGITWYSFTYGGSGALHLDTLGSTLTVNTFGSLDDTEMGLYGTNGALIASNDDANASAGVYTSILDFADGSLPAGTYYLAVGGFNSVFDAGFAASSTSISTGSIVVNGITVPEPTSLATLGLITLVARRRR